MEGRLRYLVKPNPNKMHGCDWVDWESLLNKYNELVDTSGSQASCSGVKKEK